MPTNGHHSSGWKWKIRRDKFEKSWADLGKLENHYCLSSSAPLSEDKFSIVRARSLERTGAEWPTEQPGKCLMNWLPKIAWCSENWFNMFKPLQGLFRTLQNFFKALGRTPSPGLQWATYSENNKGLKTYRRKEMNITEYYNTLYYKDTRTTTEKQEIVSNFSSENPWFSVTSGFSVTGKHHDPT